MTLQCKQIGQFCKALLLTPDTWRKKFSEKSYIHGRPPRLVAVGMTRLIKAALLSIRILMDKSLYRGLQQNLKIQPHRPMIDVV
jgi:hypothetical protein